ncbi:hypothetical protein [Rhodococcus pyridinivorans]|uniref:Uncharacterized protein n=1 Tax=Rhodococcus pyridinivorans AK37 TaxID=1114960 RepID=H0JL74_9NOCA|nr:hypothetical protein [Rhodococcus pyridinivorans]EHK86409.1 hypothetical protein AK37_01637 [Rhodococcus pyridinivorans AK37]MCD2139500.1 hypothetical protein [Rhodococcus pyridinivorans]
MARLDVPDTYAHTITTQGCDDSATVRIELTRDEARAVAKVAREINYASDYSCMPKLYIEEGVAEKATGIEVDE